VAMTMALAACENGLLRPAPASACARLTAEPNRVVRRDPHEAGLASEPRRLPFCVSARVADQLRAQLGRVSTSGEERPRPSRYTDGVGGRRQPRPMRSASSSKPAPTSRRRARRCAVPSPRERSRGRVCARPRPRSAQVLRVARRSAGTGPPRPARSRAPASRGRSLGRDRGGACRRNGVQPGGEDVRADGGAPPCRQAVASAGRTPADRLTSPASART